MTDTTLEIQNLIPLLHRQANDPSVTRILGGARIEHAGHVGYVERSAAGVSIMFEVAGTLIPHGDVLDPHELRVSAFHLHRGGHEGYAEYTCPLPSTVAFGDTEAAILRKLGPALATGGGGGFIALLKRTIPRWLRYQLDGALLHLQLDDSGGLEMATLQVYVPGAPR